MIAYALCFMLSTERKALNQKDYISLKILHLTNDFQNIQNIIKKQYGFHWSLVHPEKECRAILGS